MKPTACYPDYGCFCTGLCDSTDTLTPECPSCFGEGSYEEEQDFYVPCDSCSAAGYYLIYQWFPCGTINKQCNDEQQ